MHIFCAFSHLTTRLLSLFCIFYTEYDFVSALKASKTPEQVTEIMLKVNKIIHRRNRKVKRRSLKLDRVGMSMVRTHHSSLDIVSFKSSKSIQALK